MKDFAGKSANFLPILILSLCISSLPPAVKAEENADSCLHVQGATTESTCLLQQTQKLRLKAENVEEKPRRHPLAELRHKDYAFAEDYRKQHFKVALLQSEASLSWSVHEDAMKISKSACERDFFLALESCVQPLDDGTTQVITGDIESMWIRDSSAEIWPYVKLAQSEGKSSKLRAIIEGTVRRQAKYISTDPYANSFNDNWNINPDRRLKRGGYVGTENFEIDSNAYFFRLLIATLEAFPDTKLKEEHQIWEAVKKAVDVYRIERNHFGDSTYKYPRAPPYELPGKGGQGLPVKYTGMIWGAFRPSDDAQEYGFNVASNLFVASQLEAIANISRTYWKDEILGKDADDLRKSIIGGVKKHGTKKLADGSTVYCYEVDGLGGCNLMDDANVPSLLSLPYLDPSGKQYDEKIYQQTRKFILSSKNPWYFEGSAGKGIGSPHTGQGMIWPMSLVMQAFTAQNEEERKQVLKTLTSLDLHSKGLSESFHKDDPEHITREWFAWPNSLFSEYMVSQGKCQPDVKNVKIPETQVAPRNGPLASMPTINFYEVESAKIRNPNANYK
eukprot:TRINITY_DN6893_c1_g8_i1.p1 TRINITY_DN6893_c1_g8~~TRINITY_DN6893_c1_g8_i1.p1  ORF type:complete len:561 (-),score=91.31 TRINITY_DN6893_c1_g8_i1:102-1784(-)